MFQKDYWSKDNKELEVLAVKYNIPPVSLADPNNVGSWYIDRPRIIAQLTARDAARQSNVTLALSAFSFLVSIVAIIISLAK